MKAESIEEVIAILSDIIDECWLQNSRLGFFPAMYRKVTVQVKEGIESGRFEDGERMDRLDVVFANRYIKAYGRHRQGLEPRRAWAYAFAMAEESHPMIVQHLVLGMNAHINLDLVIATAQVAQGEELNGLKKDFFEVNKVLAGLLDVVQTGIGDSSPLFRALDRLGWSADEAICNFSIRRARRAAWLRAQMLHEHPDHGMASQIEEIDEDVTLLAKLICPPIGFANALFQAISDTEVQEPRQVIDELR